MKLQVYINKEKGEPFIVLQKQRTGADDGSPAYETVQVGTGYCDVLPSGEIYLNLKIDGLTDNKPKS